MTEYYICLRRPLGEEDYLPLEAKNPRHEMRLYLQEHVIPAGTQVFLTFYREADGQKGYINQDGNAAITGTAWEVS